MRIDNTLKESRATKRTKLENSWNPGPQVPENSKHLTSSKSNKFAMFSNVTGISSGLQMLVCMWLFLSPIDVKFIVTNFYSFRFTGCYFPDTKWERLMIHCCDRVKNQTFIQLAIVIAVRNGKEALFDDT